MKYKRHVIRCLLLAMINALSNAYFNNDFNGNFEDEIVEIEDMFDYVAEHTAIHSDYGFEIEDIHEAHSSFSSQKLDITELKDQPWGVKEFYLTGPSGHVLAFFQENTIIS